ncbi:hypothetical protein L873DRAFT_1719415 [Choiromyces venosus 120613-1]|uniref:Uncharacterized protein n=1 Tax=Choiromyces venosus 120613-1 TaxID=1336337 RepID=A0A3N4J0L0_9PEZI|nr:hypothetical protein L873DRAFT_1719415 [Choiromyces venosus 120613-1]
MRSFFPSGTSITGIVIWNWKRPSHIWDKEISKRKEEAEAVIAAINQSLVSDSEQQNKKWKPSTEFAELKKRELAQVKILRAQVKKFKVDKQGSRKNRAGSNTWRYVKYVAETKLWPT